MAERHIRWWPAWIILGFFSLLQVWTWFIREGIRQHRFMASVQFLLLMVLALLLWFLFLSRIRLLHRLLGLALLLSSIGVFYWLFRIQGVNGDLVPIFVPRWQLALDEAPHAGRESPAPVTLSPEESFSQFLGPTRNSHIVGVTLESDWSVSPPRELWRKKIGQGWSGFVVVGSLAITQEQRGEDEFVVAYDVATGEVRWAHQDRARYSTVVGGTGPRSTAAVQGDLVFTTGATGLLNALEMDTGAVRWRRDVLKENGSPLPDWGYSASPLVLDDVVIVPAGGPGRLLVAYRTDSGEKVWSGGDGEIGYSSPTLVTVAGIPQVVSFNRRSLTSHSPEDGHTLWTYPWSDEQPNVMQPLAIDTDLILASSGYGVGAKLLRIQTLEDGSLSPQLLWESLRLKSKFANSVFYRGYVYGLDDGIMVCLDPKTGNRKWKKGRYGHGQMLLVGSHLLVQTESGEMILIDPNPKNLNELTRFRVFDGKTWNSPALAGRFLLVRTDGEAACFEMPLAEGSRAGNRDSG